MSSEEFHLCDLSTSVLQLVYNFKFTVVNSQSRGYMSPEYAMEGIISVKSDVYSFGILLLEIVSGMKIGTTTPSAHARTHNLIDYVSVSYFISDYGCVHLLMQRLGVIVLFGKITLFSDQNLFN